MCVFHSHDQPTRPFSPSLRLHTHLFSDYDTHTTHTHTARMRAQVFLGQYWLCMQLPSSLSLSLSHLHLYQLSECMSNIGCKNRRGALNRECVEIQPSIPSLRGSESSPRWTRSGLVGYHGHWIRTNMQFNRRPLWLFYIRHSYQKRFSQMNLLLITQPHNI